MGQRFQTIFILPSVFLNEGNPNNREKKVLVYHNQWLFGYMALKMNLSIMRRIRRAIKERKLAIKERKLMEQYAKKRSDFINYFLEQSVENAVSYCGLQPIHNERKFSKSDEFEFKGFVDMGKQLSRQDNNNGFFVCEIDKKLNLRYTFISGLEDTDKHQVMDPKKYLNLFYLEEDIKKFYEESKKEIARCLEGFTKFEGINLPRDSRNKKPIKYRGLGLN